MSDDAVCTTEEEEGAGEKGGWRGRVRRRTSLSRRWNEIVSLFVRSHTLTCSRREAQQRMQDRRRNEINHIEVEQCLQEQECVRERESAERVCKRRRRVKE
jgi:hypothetical protein